MIRPVYAQEIINRALGPAVPKGAGAGLAFYIAALWRTVVIVGGLAFLIYLIWGGFQWLTASNDKAKLEEAHHKIYNSLVGLGILVASYAVIRLISSVVGFDLLNPEFPKNI